MSTKEGKKVKSESGSVVSHSLWPHGLYHPWDSPGQNTGVGGAVLLQGIFPTQGLNPDLPHFRWILYQLSYQGSPRILEWEAYPFSRGSSRSRNWTRVSCIASRFFTSWATMEVPLKRCTAKIANNPKVIFLIWLCQVCICTYVLICVHVGRALLLSLHIYIFLTVASNGFT